MLKYVNTGIVFQEIPDEVTLAINISGCPCHCPGCHSQYLWEDIGMPLTTDAIDEFVEKNGKDITCIAFMGGDADVAEVNALAALVKRTGLKTCWYSGRQELSPYIEVEHFDYIKLGPYIPSKGGLDSKTTNQRFYRINAQRNQLEDITHRFWR